MSDFLTLYNFSSHAVWCFGDKSSLGYWDGWDECTKLSHLLCVAHFFRFSFQPFYRRSTTCVFNSDDDKCTTKWMQSYSSSMVEENTFRALHSLPFVTFAYFMSVINIREMSCLFCILMIAFISALTSYSVARWIKAVNNVIFYLLHAKTSKNFQFFFSFSIAAKTTNNDRLYLQGLHVVGVQCQRLLMTLTAQHYATLDKLISLLLFSASSDIETRPRCLMNFATALSSSSEM